ncbi:MAG TPA: hypothetical protein VFI65_12580 [Streptosporangiaceae bacterium]|nr:hypothetical protein [Streptosporangiaceae bacterium]
MDRARETATPDLEFTCLERGRCRGGRHRRCRVGHRTFSVTARHSTGWFDLCNGSARTLGGPTLQRDVDLILGQVVPDSGAEITLRDAQFVIDREHGFDGWRDLAVPVVTQQSGGRDLDRWFAVSPET